MEKIKKVLITGSSGMLGYALCRELLYEYELTGLDVIESDEERLPKDKFFKIDIGDKSSTIDTIIEIKPDMIIHTAAYTDVDGCQTNPNKAYKINSFGTENVAEASKRIGVLMMYISTDFVFDGKKKSPYAEDDSPHPINIYGDSKLKGEETMKKILNRYIIVRTSWLFGPKGRNFVDTILDMTKKESILPVVDDQVGSPTYTIDLASAIHNILKKIDTSQGIYHITNSSTCSWYEFAKKILEFKNINNVKLEPITSCQLNRAASRPKMSVLDNSHYRNCMGCSLRPWQEALKEYLRALKNS